MSKTFSRQNTVDGAVDTFHKLSGLVGIDSEKISEKIRRSRSTDVERGTEDVREEAKRILEKSLEKKGKTTDEEGGEEKEDPQGLLSLTKEHVEAILTAVKEYRKGMKPPSLATVVCELVIVSPLIAMLIHFGYTNLDNCPLAALPLWLMVMGICWAISIVSAILDYIIWKVTSKVDNSMISLLNHALRAVIIFWGFYGIYLMWGSWFEHNDKDPKSAGYCPYSVMIVSKILIGFFALSWISLVIVLLCCCCVFGCLYMASK